MEKKVALLQPLMMRRDYGKTEDKVDKAALMYKEIPIEDYDQASKEKETDKEFVIEDYDAHPCGCKQCFLCDR
jgi:hypothetical protein